MSDNVYDVIEKYIHSTYKKKQFVSGRDVLPVSYACIYPDNIYEVVKSILSGWFTEGKYCSKFLRGLKYISGLTYGILCNSGSSANLLAVTAAKNLLTSPERKLVITTATAFSTTVAPIIQNNFIPIFLDTNPEYLNVTDYDLIYQLLQRKDVAGIILAHTLGFPYASLKIANYCYETGKWLIEDCCDALGAYIHGQSIGTFGNIMTLSFFPAHQICSMEGGAVLTDSKDLYSELHILSNWGRDCVCAPGQQNTCGNRFGFEWKHLPYGYDHKYVYTRIGYNMKMTEPQAALGASQLSYLDDFVFMRLSNFQYLLDNLQALSEYYGFVTVLPSSRPSPFGFPIIVKIPERDARHFAKYLWDNKIDSRPIFAGNITRHPIMDAINYEIVGGLDGSDIILDRGLWIGCHPLLTRDNLDYIIEKIYDYTRL